MNLLKTFEIIKHDLLLVKLKSYGFSEIKTLKLMWSYLKDRRQAVQINNSFRSCKKVQAGVLLS